jgi:hypothetical protein
LVIDESGWLMKGKEQVDVCVEQCSIVTTPSFPINVRVFEVVEAIRNGQSAKTLTSSLGDDARNQNDACVRRSAGESALIQRVRKREKILAPIKGTIKPHHAR